MPASFRCAVSLPPNVRDAFATGAWDTTGQLLDRYEEVNEHVGTPPVRRGLVRGTVVEAGAEATASGRATWS